MVTILALWAACSICLAVVLGACSQATQDSASIQFVLEPMDGQATSAVQDARFYIHGIELIAANGQEKPFVLAADGVWQSEQVALVDLAGNSPEDRHAAVIGGMSERDAQWNGIRFVVGVPFALNHADPLKAQAPLNRGDLFWTWQSGYKFLRMDLRGADLSGDEREWSYHLGSTGCSSASALRPPHEPCRQPNRMIVELRGFDPLSQPILVRVDNLLRALQTAESTACTGDYQREPACAAAYALTGLDPATGSCSSASCAQQLFSTSTP